MGAAPRWLVRAPQRGCRQGGWRTPPWWVLGSARRGPEQGPSLNTGQHRFTSLSTESQNSGHWYWRLTVLWPQSDRSEREARLLATLETVREPWRRPHVHTRYTLNIRIIFICDNQFLLIALHSLLLKDPPRLLNIHLEVSTVLFPNLILSL